MSQLNINYNQLGQRRRVSPEQWSPAPLPEAGFIHCDKDTVSGKHVDTTLATLGLVLLLMERY